MYSNLQEKVEKDISGALVGGEINNVK